MEEKNEVDKLDDVILPGFRFHPTDEELVGFYLKRKVLQQSLPIELIKQVDIYKYDPWDLPKLAATGEREWYFYCPRDRKYRNSARPNRVTGSGFWKATGTDRPIYSSDGAKCIGLKKSLVFYRGRAAKGIKTDWMMHEFRLPSLSDSVPPKKFFDKSLPINDSWAICRIFKKVNSMAQRALAHSWVSQFPENATVPDLFNQGSNIVINPQFSPDNDNNISCATETRSTVIQGCNSDSQNTSSPASFSSVDHCPSFKPIACPIVSKAHTTPTSATDIPNNFIFPTIDMILNLSPANFTGDVGKVTDCIDFGGSHQQFNGFPVISLLHSQQLMNSGKTFVSPCTLPSPASYSGSLSWDSAPCPSELSTSYSSNKCFR